VQKSKRSTPKTLHRAGELRKEQTPAEVKLWAYLRTLREDGIHFRRQHAIGPYITDFCAPRCKLIIEVDGSQHLDQEEYDTERTVFLESKGYRILRFWNSDVINKIKDVIGMVLEELARGNSKTGQEIHPPEKI
jgi:very-short-patch-repair endonuclease